MIRYPASVSVELLEILRELMKIEELEAFNLGGGTSLALAFGHRRSIDIDLFTESRFDSIRILDTLKSAFAELEVLNRTAGSLCLSIRSIKLDMLSHPYPLIEALQVEEGIRFLSLSDISAMKVNAVTNRGSKKDFSDLLLLHENGIALPGALDNFCRKYGEAGRFLAIRSLSWFGDAESEPDPVYLNGWTWPEVRVRMESMAIF